MKLQIAKQTNRLGEVWYHLMDDDTCIKSSKEEKEIRTAFKIAKKNVAKTEVLDEFNS